MVKLVDLWPQKISNSSEIKDALEVYEGQDESVEAIQNSMNTFESSRISFAFKRIRSKRTESLEVTDEKVILFLRDEDLFGVSAGSQTLESTLSKSISLV